MIDSLNQSLTDLNTVTSGTGTRNEDYADSTNFLCNWRKCGRVCTVDICVRALSNYNSTSTPIITGLPNPAMAVQMVITYSSSSALPVIFRLNTSGQITAYYANLLPAGSDGRGSITYITAE